jgi:hypothetical protein
MPANPASIADVLDELRPLIVAARAGGNPRYALVPPGLFDAVSAYRSRDRALGLPVTLLGLELVRADEPAAALRVF